MTRKVIRIAAILVLVFIFILGFSRTYYRSLGSEGYLPDDYKYGDLYRFTNLHQFRVERPVCAKLYTDFTPRKNIALYAIGDSFMEKGSVDANDFITKSYSYTHWNYQDSIRLKPGVRNVLLIESVERHFREHLAKAVTNIVVSERAAHTESVHSSPEGHSDTNDLEEFLEGENEVRLTFPEERWDNLLFNWSPILAIREFKAWLTLTLFDRVHPMTSLSPDRQHVFLKLDTDPKKINSDFNPLEDTEVTAMIDSLNASYDAYRASGFDEVYLSIIPNKTTIAAPDMGRYNRLIDRIQSDKRLKIKIIDAYGLLKPLGAAAYQKGDSHWTCQSRDLWLRRVNAELETLD